MDNFRKLDTKRVNAFIQWAHSSAQLLMKQQGTSAPSLVEVHRIAWLLLKQTVRGDPRHRYDDDHDAAAAEHYMYIRFLAGRTGDPACHAAPVLYAAKKLLDQVLGRLQSGRAQDGHPVLPANPAIVAWGQKGVADGLADYKLANRGAPYRIGSGVGVLAAFSLSQDLADRIGRLAVKAGNGAPDYLK